MRKLSKRDYMWRVALLLLVAGAVWATATARRGAQVASARAMALEQQVERLDSELREVRKQAERARVAVNRTAPVAGQDVEESSAGWPLAVEEILRAPEGVEVREVNPDHLPPADPVERARLGRLVARDAAMDREFDRLERRAEVTTDDVERDYVMALMESLLAVSALFDQLESATPDERATLQRDVQAAIGDVIRLSRTDRNHRLAEYARSIGLSGREDITAFIQDVEAVFRDTDTDWSRLLQTGRQGAGH